MARKHKHMTAPTADSSLTLAELGARYLQHMEAQGKSAGTCASYGMELKLAQSELGAETLVAALTADAIARFNGCARVTLLKSGKAKSQLSIDKTRRVLRLALTWAHQEGLLASAVVDSKKDALPGEDAAGAILGALAVQAEPVAPKRKRARKLEAALEVPQAEAEQVADAVEEHLAVEPLA